MNVSTKKTCITEECTARKARNNQYCWKHLRENAKAVALSPERQKSMRSHCCSAKCSVGEQHEYGNQYCKKCGSACLWKPAS